MTDVEYYEIVMQWEDIKYSESKDGSVGVNDGPLQPKNYSQYECLQNVTVKIQFAVIQVKTKLG